ncbi:piggyBac transposable element-derived protein 3-like [Anabrus simplex]|uniref:piggyBac transposable element-derived protein 3-like n=1 Tax=Anabrus simplex TaxID=316456 RepID=UPI0035A36856
MDLPPRVGHTEGFLNDDLILEFLNNSDIDEQFSDDDDDDPMISTYEHPVEVEPLESEADEQEEETNCTAIETPSPGPRTDTTPRRLFWKKKYFQEKPHPVPIDYTNIQNPPSERTPLQYHEDYFDDDFFNLAAEKTNMYSVVKTGKSINTNPQELKKFFGINLLMGCIRYPRLSMYWQKGIQLNLISECMSRDRFLLLRKHLHVVDTVNKPNDADSNALWKVQPVIQKVRDVCLQLPRGNGSYSIDEQMIPFLGRCKLKQYVKNKPRPVGLKNFVLTTSKGLVLDFEVYQGQSTPLVNRELGLGPAVIMRLVSSLPQGSFVYFDRYFTTIPLLQVLSEKGIEGTGTVMKNRIRDIELSQKKMNRGESNEYVRSDEKIVVTEWMDNQKVVMASTCAGKHPELHVRRWSKAEKRHVEVDCPSVVCKYNQCMGGVDICNQQMECYRTWFRTRKWTVKVILHFLDLATVNSWMLYREDALANKRSNREIKDLLKFRMSIAEARLATPARKRRTEDDGNRGIEEVENGMPEPPKKIYTPSPIPGVDKRYDGYDHWPVVDDIHSSRICRLESCCKRTKLRCEKCDVYLCLSKDKCCFKLFHVKPRS